MAAKAIDVARHYLEAIATQSVSNIMALWAEDPVLHTPLIPDASHRKLVGREALEQAYQGILGNFKNYEWINVQFHMTEDPSLVIVQCSSRGDLKNGKEYRNDYVFFLRVRNDKIIEATEYFSPISAAVIFAP